jgi:hypothetical protein
VPAAGADIQAGRAALSTVNVFGVRERHIV